MVMGLGDRHQKKDIEAALKRAEGCELKVKESIADVPSWHFIMHAYEPITSEQDNIMAHLDCFADGFVGTEQGPGFTKFECYFEADSLMDAMKQALARMEQVPGVLISGIELSPRSFEHNGMDAASVLPPPTWD